ncbi:hypothetical protein SADUNF_Sadunf03G0022400 [Salix dunnii]|uniref:RING-type E3 ubiquitin transferase n=1 Tax=Salix dunnii TaxID=1413687 RepID=A0A835N1K1_9ROSI|nr:hypothetical protein SADUNF_Sadunf03G0022400 [Salix dunnii]
MGLTRLVPLVLSYNEAAAAGAFCYVDLEYQQTGMSRVKSDERVLWVLTHQVEQAIEKGTFSDDQTQTDRPCYDLRKIKDRPDLASVVLPELKPTKR